MPSSSKNLFESASKRSRLSFPVALGGFSKIPNLSAAFLILGSLFQLKDSIVIFLELSTCF